VIQVAKFMGMFHGVEQVGSDMAEWESTFGLSVPYHDYEQRLYSDCITAVI